MLTSDERKLEENFVAELTTLENKYLKLGLDPDCIADTLRNSGNGMDLWRRRARFEDEA